MNADFQDFGKKNFSPSKAGIQNPLSVGWVAHNNKSVGLIIPILTGSKRFFSFCIKELSSAMICENLRPI